MKQLSELDAFTRAYIEAAIWTECHEDISNELRDKGIDDLAPEAIESMAADCKRFQEENWSLLERALTYSGEHCKELYGPKQSGHDFWLTRNGHGAGFWDRDLGEIGKRLTEAADKYANISLYLGGDGNIYIN